MKRYVAAILVPVLVMACSDRGDKDDVTEVRACYEGYFAALREGRGRDAAELVDSNTLGHYTHMLLLARDADSATVSGLDAMDKLTVLAMRVGNSASDLRKMDAKDAIARAVDDGLMNGDGPEGLALGTVTVNEDEASAPLKLHGFPTPASFVFRREKGGWRIDITSLFGLSRTAFQHMVNGSGKNGDAFVVEMLEETTGRPVPPDVWHPGARP